jgi:hypothetical protein
MSFVLVRARKVRIEYFLLICKQVGLEQHIRNNQLHTFWTYEVAIFVSVCIWWKCFTRNLCKRSFHTVRVSIEASKVNGFSVHTDFPQYCAFPACAR